jgi:hypothetical protein
MGGGEGAGRPGTLQARCFFWPLAQLPGVTRRSFPAGGGGGGGIRRRDSRARAARDWRGWVQAAGARASQLQTQCNWIPKTEVA